MGPEEGYTPLPEEEEERGSPRWWCILFFFPVKFPKKNDLTDIVLRIN